MHRGGESADTKCGCVGKISCRTGIFFVKYRAIFGTDFNQYSAHILATKCTGDMKRRCMGNSFFKEFFHMSSFDNCHHHHYVQLRSMCVGAKIRKIWHILPISPLYRPLPLLASTSQLDDDDEEEEQCGHTLGGQGVEKICLNLTKVFPLKKELL